MPATQERGGEVSKWPRQRLKANRDRAVGGVCVCGGGGSVPASSGTFPH